MRADEFVTEAKQAKIHPHHDSAIPNAKMMPRVDQGYGLYRFGLHMATSPEPPNIASHGASGTTPFFIPYTDADEDIIKHACKAGGFGSIRNLTKGKSAEPDDTHRISPVTAINKPRKRKLRK